MKYGLAQAINIFNLGGIFACDIEETKLLISKRSETVSAGKITKQGEEIELDGFAMKGDVLWLIEYTDSRSLDTKDFDNFIQKITLLGDDENKMLIEAINKIWSKYKVKETKPNITVKTQLIGLYIAPMKGEADEATLLQRIPRDKRDKTIFFWGRDTFEYFYSICESTRRNAQYEIYGYFNLEPKAVFEKKEVEDQEGYVSKPYVDIEKGIFGCRMIIFKISPTSLLRRCYVLRNEGWKSDSFQRMIIQEKLKKLRSYIVARDDSSFANSIILSLDPNISSNVLKEDTKSILLPNRFASLCIIDGQHRLLAFTQDFYGESDPSEKENDGKIKRLAENEDLIATLLVFNGKPQEILRKQTQLFRDINATQTKVKSDFLYNLEEIIEPKNPSSVGNKIIKSLNRRENGVFHEKFSVKWYQGGRIKRSSVIQWGLVDLVKKDGLLYKCAPRSTIEKYSKGDVEDYVVFCANSLEDFFYAIRQTFKKKYPKKKSVWDFSSKSKLMLLSTSAIVGFLRLYRHFLHSKILKSNYEEYLSGIEVKFNKVSYKYSSSQWAKLEEAMFDDIREKYGSFGDESLIKRSKKI